MNRKICEWVPYGYIIISTHAQSIENVNPVFARVGCLSLLLSCLPGVLVGWLAFVLRAPCVGISTGYNKHQLMQSLVYHIFYTFSIYIAQYFIHLIHLIHDTLIHDTPHYDTPIHDTHS
jgi:hypothetical protein